MASPNPEPRPEKARFTLRVQPDLLQRLHQIAAADGVSVADWLRLLAVQELDRRSARKGA